MIYEHIAVLWLFFYLMSFSTGYTIQTHSFYLVSIVYLLTFENESTRSRLTFDLLFIYLSLLREVHRSTQISYVLQFFHEHRI